MPGSFHIGLNGSVEEICEASGVEHHASLETDHMQPRSCSSISHDGDHENRSWYSIKYSKL